MPEFVSPIRLTRDACGDQINGNDGVVGQILAVHEIQNPGTNQGAIIIPKGSADLGLMATPPQLFPAWMAFSAGFFTATDGVGTWFLGEQGKVKSGVQGTSPADVFEWNPADFPNVGSPESLLLAARLCINGIAPGIDVTVALKKVTLGGNAGQISYTAGATHPTGATHTWAAADLAAGQIKTVALGINKPADNDKYGVAITLSGTWLADAAFSVVAGIQWTAY